MAASRKPLSPTWSDVEPHLADLDRAKLLNLIADLYTTSAEIRAFLHARFDVGEDPLTAYKKTILRGICPDIFDRKDVSIATAKKAITDYRHAVGKPEGLAEVGHLTLPQFNAVAGQVPAGGERVVGVPSRSPTPARSQPYRGPIAASALRTLTCSTVTDGPMTSARS